MSTEFSWCCRLFFQVALPGVWQLYYTAMNSEVYFLERQKWSVWAMLDSSLMRNYQPGLYIVFCTFRLVNCLTGFCLFSSFRQYRRVWWPNPEELLHRCGGHAGITQSLKNLKVTKHFYSFKLLPELVLSWNLHGSPSHSKLLRKKINASTLRCMSGRGGEPSSHMH